MEDELVAGVSAGGAVEIVVGRTGVDVPASVVASSMESIGNLGPDGVGHHGSSNAVGEGSSHTDRSSPHVVSIGIAVDSFERSGHCQPGQFNAAPSGGESAGRVVVVHCEVHLGVAVREDDLVHNQREVGLARRGLNTGYREGREDLSEGA